MRVSGAREEERASQGSGAWMKLSGPSFPFNRLSRSEMLHPRMDGFTEGQVAPVPHATSQSTPEWPPPTGRNSCAQLCRASRCLYLAQRPCHERTDARVLQPALLLEAQSTQRRSTHSFQTHAAHPPQENRTAGGVLRVHHKETLIFHSMPPPCILPLPAIPDRPTTPGIPQSTPLEPS